MGMHTPTFGASFEFQTSRYIFYGWVVWLLMYSIVENCIPLDRSVESDLTIDPLPGGKMKKM